MKLKLISNLQLLAISVFLSTLMLSISGCKPREVDITDYSAEVASSWNEIVMNMAIEEDGLLTLKGVRTEAMIFIAMHDALNAISPQYSDFLHKDHVPSAHPVAAASQAAYDVAINQFPDRQDILKKELVKWLEGIPDSPSKENALKLGKTSAKKIIELREGDQYNGEADYVWHPMAPGVYAEFNEHSGTPEGFIFGAGWAAAQPFMIPEQGYFRSPPPPDISSEDYTKAFHEVKEVGRSESELRTEDQAHLAMWWKDFVENSHNRLARQLIIKENLNLWESARVFALLNMAIYDGYISVFDNKFHYNHWRPYTAIRWASNDGNPGTEPDPDWNNLHKHTYAFPSYPSAHGTASTAAMTVLAGTLGKGDAYHFIMTTEEVDKAGPFSGKIRMNPSTREFNSFSQAGMEASMSRVYLGIHFRYDSEEGFNLGKKIGTYALQNFLTPVNSQH
ncbi:MAG TPA: vanadium-dependent haloperoxidase [Eudoraea sp.]|nr:vanadium-dependent haloperoxidase [Eudoraea sp.]